MMRAFAPSAATASDATTTSGLGSGLSNGSQSKKGKKVKRYAISRLWLVGLVCQRKAV